MEFSKEDLISFKGFLQSMSDVNNELIAIEINDFFQLDSLTSRDTIKKHLFTSKDSIFLKDENTRIAILFSSLKMIANKTELNLNGILFIKNLGLVLGLNAIGTATLIQNYHTSVNEFSILQAYSCFSIYQN